MPDKPTSHDALIAKMDALVGRHRADPAADTDEIPVLTEIVSQGVAKPAAPIPSEASALAISAAPTAQPAEKDSAAHLNALIETKVMGALKQQLGEQLHAQLLTQISNAIREVLERESELLAHRIAARVSELLRERPKTAR